MILIALSHLWALSQGYMQSTARCISTTSDAPMYPAAHCVSTTSDVPLHALRNIAECCRQPFDGEWQAAESPWPVESLVRCREAFFQQRPAGVHSPPHSCHCELPACHAMPPLATLRHPMPPHATPCHHVPPHLTLCHAMPCHAMPLLERTCIWWCVKQCMFLNVMSIGVRLLQYAGVLECIDAHTTSVGTGGE